MKSVMIFNNVKDFITYTLNLADENEYLKNAVKHAKEMIDSNKFNYSDFEEDNLSDAYNKCFDALAYPINFIDDNTELKFDYEYNKEIPSKVKEEIDKAWDTENGFKKLLEKYANCISSYSDWVIIAKSIDKIAEKDRLNDNEN